ncbi:hypothetical protein ACH35V_32400 [Actinomadura sp. 1N219]|uniref:hypothetical protein n=1 Tax=Actinomadura sp. 1N219 TaxID=3375152 RepID=UPI003796D90F
MRDGGSESVRPRAGSATQQCQHALQAGTQPVAVAERASQQARDRLRESEQTTAQVVALTDQLRKLTRDHANGIRPGRHPAPPRPRQIAPRRGLGMPYARARGRPCKRSS